MCVSLISARARIIPIITAAITAPIIIDSIGNPEMPLGLSGSGEGDGLGDGVGVGETEDMYSMTGGVEYPSYII